MPNDEKPIDNPDGEEDVLDVALEEVEAFGQCLAWLLAGLVSGPVDRGARVNVTPLDAADRKALSSLGTPEEFVRRKLAQIKDMPPEPQALIDTYRDTAADGTVPKKAQEKSTTSPEYAELLEHKRAFRNCQRVSWSCEYTKIKKLGRGGQGVVHLVQNDFGEQRAMKTLSAEPYGDAAAYHDDMERMKELPAIYPKRHDNLL
jgi:hypothetical protein